MDQADRRAIDKLAGELGKLQRRLDRIEHGQRGQQLTDSSIEDGSIPAYDASGNQRQRVGRQSDGTFAITYSSGPAPGRPSTPTVSARQLALVVGWDRTMADGSGAPADVAQIDVHASEVSGFTPDGTTIVGSMAVTYKARVTDVGRVLGFVADNLTHYVKLVAVSTSGAASEPSEEVAATPLPVSELDVGALDGETITGATLRTAGSGKRVVIASEDDGNQIYMYSGAEFETAQGHVTTVVNNPGAVEFEHSVLDIQSPQHDLSFPPTSIKLFSQNGAGVASGIEIDADPYIVTRAPIAETVADEVRFAYPGDVGAGLTLDTFNQELRSWDGRSLSELLGAGYAAVNYATGDNSERAYLILQGPEFAEIAKVDANNIYQSYVRCTTSGVLVDGHRIGSALLDETEILVDRARILFTGIPQDFRHLLIVASGGITGTAIRDVDMIFNDGVDQCEWFRSARTAAGGFDDNADQAASNLVWGRWAHQSHTSSARIWIYDYSSARTKRYQSRFNASAGDSNADWRMGQASGQYYNTSGLTDIEIRMPSAESFQAGSVFSLYGYR